MVSAASEPTAPRATRPRWPPSRHCPPSRRRRRGDTGRPGDRRRATRTADNAAQAVATPGQQYHGRAGRDEHAPGRQAETAYPGRPAGRCGFARAVNIASFGIIISSRHLSREYGIKPLGHAVGHGWRRDRREQHRDPGERVVEDGAVIAACQVRGDLRTAPPGDESRAELGQDIGVQVGHLPPHAVVTRSLTGRLPAQVRRSRSRIGSLANAPRKEVAGPGRGRSGSSPCPATWPR